ncbi:MAG: AMP-binding protein [Opitutae bacterium]|nr:AMP-binding protein [Opitutae bacterium]
MERAELSRLLGGAAGGGAPSLRCLAEADAGKFTKALANAVAGSGDVFLGNPEWGKAERAQVDAVLRTPRPARPDGRGWLMIPTGGTSGSVRFARHDEATIAAAVGGFARHFGVGAVNAVGLLPLHHVSGLLAWLRCRLTRGNYVQADWRMLERGTLPVLPAAADGWFLSLVPTQLERLLRRPLAVEWLKQFRAVLVGGAPAWPDLLDRAATARLPLAPSYGMTETAAMVTALRPEEFLAGARSSGSALPHAAVKVNAEGAVSVTGESVFRGYYPEWREERTFETADAGWLDDGGRLTVTGRRDAVVITGGEKVQPAEVEALLRDTGEFAEVVVLGVPDAEWGQLLVAAYPAAATPRLKKVADAMARQLAPHKRPKFFVPLAVWPANAQGKINRAEVARLVGAAF